MKSFFRRDKTSVQNICLKNISIKNSKNASEKDENVLKNICVKNLIVKKFKIFVLINMKTCVKIQKICDNK